MPRVPLFVAALVALCLGVLWTTQAMAHVERSDDVHVHDAWEEKGSFTWDEPARTAFLTTAKPQLSVTFAWAADGGASEGAATLAVVADGADRTGAWRVALPLAQHDGTAGPVRMSGMLDMPALAEAAKQAGHGDITNATYALVAKVAFSAKDAAQTSEFRLPIRYEAPLYVLDAAAAASATRDHGTPEVTHHETRAGLGALRQAPLLPATMLVGAAGIVLAFRPERDA